MVLALPAGLRVTREHKPPASRCPANSTLERGGGTLGISETPRGVGETVLPGTPPRDFPLCTFMGRLGGNGLGIRWRGVGGAGVQLALVRPPWQGTPGSIPHLEAGSHLLTSRLPPAVCLSARALGLCGRLGSGVGTPPEGRAWWVLQGRVSQESSWHPCHPASAGTDTDTWSSHKR